MKVLEYEASFHKLPIHATTILPTEYEWIWYFVRGLRLSLCMATQSLVVIGKFFVEVSCYAHTMKDIHHNAQRSSDKRPCQQDSFSRNRVDHSSKAQVIGLAIFWVSLISTGVNLEGLFRQYFSSRIGDSSIIVTTMARAESIFERCRFQVCYIMWIFQFKQIFWMVQAPRACYDYGVVGYSSKICPQHGMIQPTTLSVQSIRSVSPPVRVGLKIIGVIPMVL